MPLLPRSTPSQLWSPSQVPTSKEAGSVLIKRDDMSVRRPEAPTATSDLRLGLESTPLPLRPRSTPSHPLPPPPAPFHPLPPPDSAATGLGSAHACSRRPARANPHLPTSGRHTPLFAYYRPQGCLSVLCAFTHAFPSNWPTTSLSLLALARPKRL